MIATVQRTIEARFPQIRGKRVLVAASGGADSTALALALVELGFEIVLAHVHHGIRGRAADADARFVRDFAKKLGVPFLLGKFDVPGEAKRSGESLEMAARRARREFLVATAKRESIVVAATGHTADDQAETILMRIARGTGIRGLAGIPYKARLGRVQFVRPLRDACRREVEAYLMARGATWREDETNADDFAMRNRVRHEILPMLEKRLNPAVRRALLRLGEIADAEDKVMSALAKKACRKDADQMPVALRRRIAREKMERGGIPPNEITFAAVEKTLPHGILSPAETTAGRQFPFARKDGTNNNRGEENAGDGPWLRIEEGRGFTRSADEVCLSMKAVGGRGLLFRGWRAGDRMKPLGMKGSKKLSDIFTDLKVPRGERGRYVVIECGGEIAALAGWRVSRDFAVEGPRSKSLRIRIGSV